MLDATPHSAPQQEIWRRRRSACRVVQLSDALEYFREPRNLITLERSVAFPKYKINAVNCRFLKQMKLLFLMRGGCFFILNMKEKIFKNPSEKC